MITCEREKMKKSNQGYLGKLRSNFLGTEFTIYNSGKNPKKAKNESEIREQHGFVEYETNVLGSKGPRRMKVLLPRVNRDSA
jgi:tubby-related protein 1